MEESELRTPVVSLTTYRESGHYAQDAEQEGRQEVCRDEEHDFVDEKQSADGGVQQRMYQHPLLAATFF